MSNSCLFIYFVALIEFMSQLVNSCSHRRTDGRSTSTEEHMNIDRNMVRETSIIPVGWQFCWIRRIYGLEQPFAIMCVCPLLCAVSVIFRFCSAKNKYKFGHPVELVENVTFFHGLEGFPLFPSLGQNLPVL